MNHLSKTSKLNSKSWSLPAFETCPGARDVTTGDEVPACSGCYARAGFYVFPHVKRTREENLKAWREEGWVAEMVAALKKQVRFRWFDSGDVYHVDLGEKILQVIEQTPHVKHWLPTRSYKIDRIRAVLEKIAALPNAAVRYSSDSITGEYIPGLHGSTITQSAKSIPVGTFLCDAYSRGGTCGPCNLCYEKEGVVAYPAHGKKMKKIVRETLVQITRK
jgi:hypothetical protein